MTDLRKLAKDRPCQIRLPGICNGNPATTVLAHYRLIGISGMGFKANDLCGAWACHNCHDAVDGRRYRDLDRNYARLCHLEGVIRTQSELIEEGKVQW